MQRSLNPRLVLGLVGAGMFNFSRAMLRVDNAPPLMVEDEGMLPTLFGGRGREELKAYVEVEVKEVKVEGVEEEEGRDKADDIGGRGLAGEA